MGMSPNAILLLVVTPKDDAVQTYKNILKDENLECPIVELNEDGTNENEYYYPDYPSITISGKDFYSKFCKDDSYEEGVGITSKKNTIILYSYIASWDENTRWSFVEDLKNKLDNWAKLTSKKHNCTYEFFITANYF